MVFNITVVLGFVFLCLIPIVYIFYNIKSLSYFFTWLFINATLTIVVLSLAQLKGLTVGTTILVAASIIVLIYLLKSVAAHKVTNTSSDTSSDNSWTWFNSQGLRQGLQQGPQVEKFDNGPILNVSVDLWQIGPAAMTADGRNKQGPCITADNKAGMYIPSLYGQTCVSYDDLKEPPSTDGGPGTSPGTGPGPSTGTNTIGCSSAMHYDGSKDADITLMDYECQKTLNDDRAGLMGISTDATCKEHCPQNEEKCTLGTCAPLYYKGAPIHLTKCYSPTMTVDYNEMCAADIGPNYGFKEFSPKKCLTSVNGKMANCEISYYNGIKNATSWHSDTKKLDEECLQLYPGTGVKKYIATTDGSTNGRKAICAENYYDEVEIKGNLTPCQDIVYKSADERCREYMFTQGIENSREYSAKRIIKSCGNPNMAKLECDIIAKFL